MNGDERFVLVRRLAYVAEELRPATIGPVGSEGNADAPVRGPFVFSVVLLPAVEGEGVLDAKTRNLIGFAIAASKQDEGCVAILAHALAQRRVTAQEVADAMGVVILMNGGPGHIWAQHALAVFEQCAGAA